MSIREMDKVTICRHCRRSDFDALRHGEMFGHGEELSEVACLWPCNHGVADVWEPRCTYCAPLAAEESEPF